MAQAVARQASLPVEPGAVGDLRLTDATPRLSIGPEPGAVPAYRLDRRWTATLGLIGEVLLDEALALRVVACGPIRQDARGKAAA